MNSWNKFLESQQDFIGGLITTVEDNHEFVGEIASIEVRDDVIIFETAWTLSYSEEHFQWESVPKGRVFANMSFISLEEGDNGKFNFNLPFLGHATITPKREVGVLR